MSILIRLGLADKKARLRKGRQLWYRLDTQLPRAVGGLVNDAPRVETFKHQAEKLPRRYRECLKEWLQHEIEQILRGDEHISGKQEKIERRQCQIYMQHLEAL